MFRTVALAAALFGLAVLVGNAAAADKVAKKNQMVKGTIKLADPDKDLLIVNQKVGTGVVDRELSITKATEFVIIGKNGTQEVSGRDGLDLLVDAKGESVQVKCDKDVNVLKVTVRLKK